MVVTGRTEVTEIQTELDERPVVRSVWQWEDVEWEKLTFTEKISVWWDIVVGRTVDELRVRTALRGAAGCRSPPVVPRDSVGVPAPPPSAPRPTAEGPLPPCATGRVGDRKGERFRPCGSPDPAPDRHCCHLRVLCHPRPRARGLHRGAPWARTRTVAPPCLGHLSARQAPRPPPTGCAAPEEEHACLLHPPRRPERRKGRAQPTRTHTTLPRTHLRVPPLRAPSSPGRLAASSPRPSPAPSPSPPPPSKSCPASSSPPSSSSSSTSAPSSTSSRPSSSSPPPSASSSTASAASPSAPPPSGTARASRPSSASAGRCTSSACPSWRAGKPRCLSHPHSFPLASTARPVHKCPRVSPTAADARSVISLPT